MKVVLCPFCGMATNLPHEAQGACITALNEEIARTRHVLENITEPLRPPVASADEDAQTT
jgi:hypothetical protein